MTRVVNVKVAHIRPEYNNLKEWMDDENNVYIGRKRIVFIDGERFPSDDSPFANPFKVSKSNDDRIAVVDRYEGYIKEKIDTGEVDITSLYGKTLGCWCKPEKCHGDILLKLIRTKYGSQ